MSFLFTSNNTLSVIVSIIEEMPNKVQESLLHQLKMKKAIAMAKKIDAIKKPKLVFSDNEIAEMVHNFRGGNKWIGMY